ncbi:hypothetical protein QVD17_27536 [Tagetes erecta]|uniref:Ionotropic glutamate receptor C-terminal domain-containing protein n=1 Tax=Tagetes erecta TaxID=13708 RepID=A0AAD8KDD3_TARER|nr:hypothetical protein QVD17_27536 [Tagetes erecta]
MEHKKHIVSFIFVVVMLCAVDLVTTSRVTTVDKRLRAETYSKVQLRKPVISTTMQDVSRKRRRRYIQEKGHVGNGDICADIIGPDWKISKQEKGPCPKLDVWVPKKTGFTEFVEVNQHSKVEGGFSIAIFCHALHLLPYNVQPLFLPFINDKGESNGTYDQLLQHIQGKKCAAVAGDVTVRSSRTQYVSFTSPYLSSEVYMLVRASHQWNQTLWTFLKPFTWRLWVTIVGICIYIGLAVAILEYRVHNPKFIVPLHQKLVMVVWFPISTFFFHEGKILNKNTKVVLVIWLSMIFIIVQIFTATLSAWLTLDQMRPRMPSSYENVGYQDGSFLKEFIIQKYNCSGTKLKPLKSIEEYKDALSNGSVDAVFDELPYVELFLAKYGSNYMKFGPINQESGIAFAFSRGSPLLQNFSRAVINVTESDTMMEMKKKYLGFRIPDGPQPNQALPQSLDVQSFFGLFIFIGTLTIAAVICSEISLRRLNSKIHQLPT